MTEEEAMQLRKENQELREALKQAQELLRVALARIEELEKQKTPPAFVKTDVKKPPAEEKKPRKKREAQHNRARRRARPTHITEHYLTMCPDCDLRLGGISLARCREVIDVPPSPAVQVTEHRIFKGWCAGCQKWHEAPVALQAEVLGQGRIGVRLASTIAYLRTSLRLPLRQIRELLRTLHGFEVSLGEIVELLHRLSTHAQPALNSQESWAAIFTRGTTSIRACINAVGSTSCATSTISKSCILTMRICGNGPKKSSRSTNEPKPLPYLIRSCPHAHSMPSE